MSLLYPGPKYIIILIVIICSICFLQCESSSIVVTDNTDPTSTNQIPPVIETDPGKVFVRAAVADFDIQYIDILLLSVDGVDLASILTTAGTDFFEHQLTNKHFQLQFSAEIKDKDGNVTSTSNTDIVIGDEGDTTGYDLAQYNYYWDIVFFINISDNGIFVDTFSTLSLKITG